MSGFKFFLLLLLHLCGKALTHRQTAVATSSRLSVTSLHRTQFPIQNPTQSLDWSFQPPSGSLWQWTSMNKSSSTIEWLSSPKYLAGFACFLSVVIWLVHCHRVVSRQRQCSMAAMSPMWMTPAKHSFPAVSRGMLSTPRFDHLSPPPRGFSRTTAVNLFPEPMSPDTAFLIPSQSLADLGKYTIVLDMDETLLSSEMQAPPLRDPNLHMAIISLPGFNIYSAIRPGAADLVRAATQAGEVVLWTAGTEPYARLAIRHVDPDGGIRHSIFRDPSWFQMPTYVKDLRRLGRPLDRVLLVDNSAGVCVQPDNAIVVRDFFSSSDSTDDVLIRLRPLLEALVKSQLPVPEFLAQCAKAGLLRQQQGFYLLGYD